MQQYEITSHLREITPEEAETTLIRCAFPNQRPLRVAKVKAMAYDMAHDSFPPGTQIVLARLPDGSSYLLNGQHRLHALTEAHTTILFDVQEIEFPSLKEAKSFYKYFDIGVPRRAMDMFIAEDLPEETGLGREKLANLNSALNLLLVGFASTSPAPHSYAFILNSMDFRTRAIRAWMPEALAFYEAISRGQTYFIKRLMTSGVMSVALVTFCFAPKNAEIFWYDVAHDNRLAPETGQKHVYHYLNDPRSRNTNKDIIARYISGAWNMFARERYVQRLMPSGSKSEGIVIEGTPHKGQRLRYIGLDGSVLKDPIAVA